MSTTRKKTVKTTTAPARRTRRAQVAAATPTVTSDQIAQLAYRYYEESGYVHGHDLDHWLRAEAELAGK
ncbi:MAG TPA: DUF2934 domain-containing protein [Kofleriaceae bacterium]|nr:DUF2934 domain-containing protein [Kofleriaceae bacterium]